MTVVPRHGANGEESAHDGLLVGAGGAAVGPAAGAGSAARSQDRGGAEAARFTYPTGDPAQMMAEIERGYLGPREE